MADTWADTCAALIAETFGLIAVEEYGGKVRLWQSSQRKAWLDENNRQSSGWS